MKLEVNKREYNLDYFRIFIMILIVATHFLGVGGGFYNIYDGNLNELTFNYNFAALAKAFTIVGVNCFVLLSGYLLVTSKFKMSKVINLVVKTLFYSIVISLLSIIIFRNSVGLGDLFRICLPVLTSSFWFITAYIALYILSPFLNKVVENISKDEYKKLLFILVMLFSVWKTFVPFAETLDTTKGYGIIWFVVLYFVGGYIRLHYKCNKGWKFYLGIYVGLTLFMYGFKIFMILASTKISVLAKAQNMFYHYNSFTVLCSAIALFLVFVSLKNLKGNKVVTTVSSLTLGVYLIHENFLLRDNLWLKVFKGKEIFTSELYVLYFILDVLIVFVVCILIEYLCENLVGWISNKIERGCTKAYGIFRKNEGNRG